MSDPTALLEERFSRVEDAHLRGEKPTVPRDFAEACAVVFRSKTKAYREVLLGCLLTRITDPDKDIHLPYVSMGPRAFSGRSLDERVINPFLRSKRIPCTQGPYLSVFRRQVSFDRSTRPKMRDKQGFDALVGLLDMAQGESNQARLLDFFDYVLYCFVLLREEQSVELIGLERVSLQQCRRLLRRLLSRQSKGIFPQVIVVSMVEAVIERFGLDWEAHFQQINVSDRAAGVEGDITVLDKASGDTVVVVEVTERSVDRSRVRSAFQEKVSPASVRDYIFAVHLNRVQPEAIEQAERYFHFGYDVNFVDIHEWVCNCLATVGAPGRNVFLSRLIAHLSADWIPATLKHAWNEEIAHLTS